MTTLLVNHDPQRKDAEDKLKGKTTQKEERTTVCGEKMKRSQEEPRGVGERGKSSEIRVTVRGGRQEKQATWKLVGGTGTVRIGRLPRATK